MLSWGHLACLCVEPDLNSYIDILPLICDRHSHSDRLHKALSKSTLEDAQNIFGLNQCCETSFTGFGRVIFPYTELGNVDSSGMFAIDELIVFAYYRLNQQRYKRVLDIGANLGVHSIMLSKLGASVKAFEPDPLTCEYLDRNLKLNNVQDKVEVIQAAIAAANEEVSFCRVVDNKAGSHIAGAKKDPYGPLEYFSVRTEPLGPYLEEADYIKIDAEGSEANIICATDAEAWVNTDSFIEVGSSENAHRIFEHFYGSSINLFSQKHSWRRAESAEDLPYSYHEGLLFITSEESMSW